MDNFVEVLATLVAVGAAAVAWIQARRAERLSTFGVAVEWQRDVRAWAAEVIDVLSTASYMCGFNDDDGLDYAADLRQCRQRLSALIDRGRFFLPNIRDDHIGQQKPAAYRGRRHGALDPLVAAERVLSRSKEFGRFDSREAALIAMRREFVSAIYSILAPEQHNQEIAQLIRSASEARANDRTLGGLLPDQASPPTGADRLLHG